MALPTNPDPQKPNSTTNTSQAYGAPASGVSPVDAQAALADSIAEEQRNKRVADRLPELKKSAYILLGLIILSAVQTLAMQQVMVSLLGAAAHKSSIITGVSVGLWILGSACSTVALATKSTKVVKAILWMVSACMLYFLLSSVLVADVIGGVIDAFVCWRIYKLYDSVQALEISSYPPRNAGGTRAWPES